MGRGLSPSAHHGDICNLHCKECIVHRNYYLHSVVRKNTLRSPSFPASPSQIHTLRTAQEPCRWPERKTTFIGSTCNVWAGYLCWTEFYAIICRQIAAIGDCTLGNFDKSFWIMLTTKQIHSKFVKCTEVQRTRTELCIPLIVSQPTDWGCTQCGRDGKNLPENVIKVIVRC